MELSYKEKLEAILEKIEEADAVVIGGASGMSAACGFDYYNHSPFFEQYFSDFGDIYNEPSCWKLLYHRYKSHEERWAYMARSGCVMLDLPAGKTYTDLFKLTKAKDYYIITTNQDAQFAKVFDPERIFTIQGDAHWMQCSNRCHDKIYPSDEILHKLNAAIEDGKLPSELVPKCPVCGDVMEPWVKSYIFHYCSQWNREQDKYNKYLIEHQNQKLVFLALGIGSMTPEFIKHPFMNMTYQLPDASMVILNKGEDPVPMEIRDKTICIDGDILKTLEDLVSRKNATVEMIMQKRINEIIQKLKDADAILVGASNGLSISEGYHLFANNEAFQKMFGDFQRKYGFRNLLDGMYARYPEEEKWAYMTRMIKYYTNDYQVTPTMQALVKLIGTRPYFIVTSNGEGHFEAAGFAAENIYEIEGNMLTMQCSKACHTKLYPAHDVIEKLAAAEEDGKVAKNLIPKCPVCGASMCIHSAVEPCFIPDDDANERLQAFLKEYTGKKIFILELGIGMRNQMIKAPLMKLADREENATYVTVNKGEIYITDNIKEKSYGLDGDMTEILLSLADAV